MPKASNVDYLYPFIEATIAASARFRRVLIVIIVASTLASVAFWNARSGSWSDSRIKVAHDAEAYLTLKEYEDKLSDNTKAIEEIRHDDLVNFSNVPLSNKRAADIDNLQQESLQILRERQRLLDKFSQTDRDNAKDWLDNRGIKKKSHLASYSERLDASRVDNVVLVRIPFFGVVLDVNDLGVLGGFTFVVIMMWFRFSLWREFYNLRSTFKAAKSDEDLRFCYMTLAMSQVLTVPPALSKRQPKDIPYGKVVRILYLLPLTVQLVIFIYDCVTFMNGWYVNWVNTIVSTSLGLTLLTLIALLTYWCFRLSSEIDNEWKETAEKLESLPVR